MDGRGEKGGRKAVARPSATNGNLEPRSQPGRQEPQKANFRREEKTVARGKDG